MLRAIGRSAAAAIPARQAPRVVAPSSLPALPALGGVLHRPMSSEVPKEDLMKEALIAALEPTDVLVEDVSGASESREAAALAADADELT